MQFILALILAVVANMVLGFLWYGPLFGKAWVGALNWDAKEIKRRKSQGMTAVWVFTILGAFITAFILSVVLRWYGAPSVFAGAAVGFVLWLGFVLPISAYSVTFEGKNMTVFWIDVLYPLASLVIMGMILALGYPSPITFY